MSYWAEDIQCQVDGNLLIGCFYVSITNSKPYVGNASYSRWIYIFTLQMVDFDHKCAF